MPVWREDEDGETFSLKILKAGRSAVQAMALATDSGGLADGCGDNGAGASAGTAAQPLPVGLSHRQHDRRGSGMSGEDGPIIAPKAFATMADAARDQLLRAIAKARRWMHEVSLDVTTFADIASKEGCVERHVRFLASLAYLSPAIIEAIADGRVPAELTISSLARNLPKDWAEQDARILG